MPFFMAKIGFFDSGVGGLTIWAEVLKTVPNVSTVYLADSVNSPYGNKTPDEIVALCRKNTKWLLSKGCDLIVVACNTATTQAIATLRNEFSVPFVGIEPAIKPAAFASKTRHIAVLATAGTLESDLFHKTKDAFTKDIQVDTRVGTGLVAEIESGNLYTNEFSSLLHSHLDALIQPSVDCLVLGCTHYPLFKKHIVKYIKTPLTIIDSGKAVANRVSEIWNTPASSGFTLAQHELYTTGNVEMLRQIALLVSPHGAATSTYSSLYQSE